MDNYSTKGNVNPYTGQAGTVTPQPTYQPSPLIDQQHNPRQSGYQQCHYDTSGRYVCR